MGAQMALERNANLGGLLGLAATVVVADPAGAVAVLVVGADKAASPALSFASRAVLELVLVSFGALCSQRCSPPIISALKSANLTFVRKV